MTGGAKTRLKRTRTFQRDVDGKLHPGSRLMSVIDRERDHQDAIGQRTMIKKIISGGQTGADQAALDVAIELGIPHGGWVPKGRKTERGPLPNKYQIQEMPTASYPARTEKNVVDSDGTLIISHGEMTGGIEYTARMAQKHDKPWMHMDANQSSVEAAVQMIKAWTSGNEIEVLNVAGPRASKDRRIYATTREILRAVLLSGNENL
jgi:Circularly permutated YpsA SLOG family